MKYKRLSDDFKKQMVEQMLSDQIKVVDIYRQHNLTRSVLYLWKEQYEQGLLEPAVHSKKSDQVKIQALERMVGRLTMDNEILKKAISLAHSQQKTNVKPSEKTKVYSEALPEDAAC